jgi:hypothetical protein
MGFTVSPWTFVFAGLEYGVTNASKDMELLLAGQSVPLPSVVLPVSNRVIDLNYRDHLRLLLLTKDKEWKLKKTMSLLELNTGRSLDQVLTAIQTDVILQRKLLFFPNMISLHSRSHYHTVGRDEDVALVR